MQSVKPAFWKSDLLALTFWIIAALGGMAHAAQAPQEPERLTSGEAVRFGWADGRWQENGDTHRWQWRIERANAARMAVAIDADWPANVRLRIEGGEGSVLQYEAADFDRGRLHTLPLAGSSLLLTVEGVRAAAPFRFAIDTLYVGHKSAANAKAASSGPPLVSTLCELGPDTIRAARSTVGLVVSTHSGQSACSGTLVNDVDSSGAHRILTAAHCGGIGSRAAHDSASITAYWNAATHCGMPLQEFSTPGVADARSTGYRSLAVVTQVRVDDKQGNFQSLSDGDHWLIGSDAPPPQGSSPVWAGLNAEQFIEDNRQGEYIPTRTIPAVYALSHPMALTQSIARFTNADAGGQFAQMRNGISCFNDDYDCLSSYSFYYDASRYSVRGGSSGSALRLPDGHVIAVLASCGQEDEVTSSGQPVMFCVYDKLASAWDGNKDGSYPGTSLPPDPAGPNLKTWLDARGSGRRTSEEYRDLTRSDNLGVQFSSAVQEVAAGGVLELKWITDDAAACERSASPARGDWSGALPPANGVVQSASITMATKLRQVFILRCTNTAGFSINRSITINPNDVPPVARFESRCKALDCQFDARASTAAGGIQRVRFEFGDGTAPVDGAQQSHRYATAGSYTVKVTVTDMAGNENAATRILAVAQDSADIAGSSGNRGGGSFGLMAITLLFGFWASRRAVRNDRPTARLPLGSMPPEGAEVGALPTTLLRVLLSRAI